MNDDYSIIEPKPAPIPPVFYSHNTQAPIRNCVECNRFLLDGSTEYIIEKAFRVYQNFRIVDTVFEYALCLDCADSLSKSFSKESIEHLSEYFGKHAEPAFIERLLRLESEETPEPMEWLGECIIKRTPVAELNEYQLVGHFEGESILLSVFPYLIGEEAVEEMVALLSNQTLDAMDDFSGKHFGIPPEFSGQPRPRLVPIF